MQAISEYENSKRERGGAPDPVLEALAARLHLTTHMLLRQQVSHDGNNRLLARELRSCGYTVRGGSTKKKQFLADVLAQAAAGVKPKDEDEDVGLNKNAKTKKSDKKGGKGDNKGDNKKGKGGKKGGKVKKEKPSTTEVLEANWQL